MPAKLVLAVVWFDADLQEVRLTAESEEFAGQVNFYAGYRELEEFAGSIQGFPSNSLDTREYSFGQADLSGYGTATINFRCRDSTGHLIAEVAMRTYPISPGEPAQSAMVAIRFVPSDLDRFVQEVRGMDNRVGAHAVLIGAA